MFVCDNRRASAVKYLLCSLRPLLGDFLFSCSVPISVSVCSLRLCGEKIICENLRKSAVKYLFFLRSPVVGSL